ncbi:hypothetical protein Droror1_Dr00017712 [Drosera rotundifolia]
MRSVGDVSKSKLFPESVIKVYLVANGDDEGKLFMVFKSWSVDVGYHTTGFLILQLNVSVEETGDDKVEIEVVRELGDWSLFLGNNESITIDASKRPECKRPMHMFVVMLRGGRRCKVMTPPTVLLHLLAGIGDPGIVPRPVEAVLLHILLDAIDSGCLTFDSGKMKVDEDQFPKATNVNMVVITLVDESIRDEPRLEGQKLTEEETRSVQRQDKKRPRVFARILEQMKNLCICCQRDIALVRQMLEEHDRNNAGPPSTV